MKMEDHWRTAHIFEWDKARIVLTYCDLVMPYGDIDLCQYISQGMTCCLTARTSHYLNQCCFLISDVLWYPPGSKYITHREPRLLLSIMSVKTILLKLLPYIPEPMS